MIERFVEHHVDARGIGGGYEVGEFLHRLAAGVGLAQQRIDLEEIFDGVRAAHGIRLAGVGIRLAADDSRWDGWGWNHSQFHSQVL